MTTWDYIGLVLFNLVNYFFFGLVRNSLDSGLTPGYTLDIFAINLGSQFIICFTRYGWYLYCLVPSYIGYKLLGYLWGYIGRTNTVDPNATTAIDPKAAKKAAKHERQEARGHKVKYMK